MGNTTVQSRMIQKHLTPEQMLSLIKLNKLYDKIGRIFQ